MGAGPSDLYDYLRPVAPTRRQRGAEEPITITDDWPERGIAAVHQILTWTTYIGEHRFNTYDSKAKCPKPGSGHVVMDVPPIVTKDEWQAVQAHLKARNPKWAPPRTVSGPTLLTGIAFCASCGGAMTMRTGKGGRYRYYTCSIRAD